mgnify:CR=1 FL=1
MLTHPVQKKTIKVFNDATSLTNKIKQKNMVLLELNVGLAAPTNSENIVAVASRDNDNTLTNIISYFKHPQAV